MPVSPKTSCLAMSAADGHCQFPDSPSCTIPTMPWGANTEDVLHWMAFNIPGTPARQAFDGGLATTRYAA